MAVSAVLLVFVSSSPDTSLPRVGKALYSDTVWYSFQHTVGPQQVVIVMGKNSFSPWAASQSGPRRDPGSPLTSVTVRVIAGPGTWGGVGWATLAARVREAEGRENVEPKEQPLPGAAGLHRDADSGPSPSPALQCPAAASSRLVPNGNQATREPVPSTLGALDCNPYRRGLTGPFLSSFY